MTLKMHRSLVAVLLAGLLALPAYADTRQVTDAMGNTVTVPEVRMSPDLKLATVYVMPLGGRDVSEVVEALDRNKRFLRGEIARRVRRSFAASSSKSSECRASPLRQSRMRCRWSPGAATSPWRSRDARSARTVPTRSPIIAW